MLKLKYPLNLAVINERLNEIKAALVDLEKFKRIPRKEFLNKDKPYFAAASYHLRVALQAMLSCTSHILTRIPRAKVGEYKENVKQLGKFKVITPDLTKRAIEMAGYRNRMVHFYHEIKHQEMYNILQKNLGDLEEFIKQISRFVEKPTS